MVRGSGVSKDSGDAEGHSTTATATAATATTDIEPGKRRQPFRACFVTRRVLGRSIPAPGTAGVQPLTGKFYSAHEERELACAATSHAQTVSQRHEGQSTKDPTAELYELPILESRLYGWLVNELPRADPLLQVKTTWRCWDDRLG